MKIIFMTKNWVGDILFEFPAIEAVKRRYPEAEIVCIAPDRCREILENHPDVNRVIPFDERGEHRPFWKRFALIWKLRREKWDQGYLFHRSRTRAFILYMAGVRERIGYAGKRKFFLTRIVPEPPHIYHQVDYFLKLVKGAGIPCEEGASYRYFFNDKDRQAAEKILKRTGAENFVCFHLGANWEPKRWPPEYFAKLADLIHEKTQKKIVVTGASRDRDLFKQMQAAVKKAGVVGLIGETNLGELGAVFKRADFMVSGDSGPLHVADGVGTRVVALFGPTNPDQTGPRGTGEKLIIRFVPEGYEAPFYGKELPKEGWISRIRPEQVFSEIEKKGWLAEAVSPQGRRR